MHVIIINIVCKFIANSKSGFLEIYCLV